MKIIREVGLEGIAGFTKTKLPIQSGVTYLYGMNALDGGNPNAAGKSVLASSAADIFYDQPMVGTKQDRSKEGSRYVKWQEKGVVHSVKSTFDNAKEKLKYRVDGAVADGRTTKMTRELIRKAWGISEEDYRSYGYLDSQNPHPLVRGTSVQRKAFFTSFFQLDILDAERKILAKQLLELKRIRAQHTELDKTFQEIKQDMLGRQERVELEHELRATQKRLKALKAEADKAQQAKSIADFKEYAKPHLKAFRALVAHPTDLDEVLRKTRKALKAALAGQEQAEDYEQYKKDLKIYKRKTAELDMSKSDEELEESAEANKRWKSQLAQLEDEIAALKQSKEPTKVKKPKLNKDEAQAAVYRLKHELEHLEQFEKGVCHTCGQPVKTRKPEAVEEELEEAKAVVKQWNAYETYLERFETWNSTVGDLELAVKKRKAVKAKFETSASDAELWSVRSKLSRPEKVDPPEDYQDPKKLEDELRVLEFFEPHQEMLVAMQTFDGKVAPFDLKKIEKMQDRVADIQAKLEVHNTVKTRASKIRSRLKELEGQLANEEALQVILAAYQDKAVKKMAVDEISRRLMATVNKYAAIAFPNYRFEFVWGAQVRLLVHRPKGTTDVRKLSGAESKLFTLILTMSQLMFKPKSKRLSLLILDEPSASFSKETLERFHRLLPYMQQLIPSILIVTPKSEERYPGAHEYTVVRDASGATVKKGHPSEITA